MDSFKKTLLIIFIFSIFYCLFGAYNFFNSGEVNTSIDFQVHWEKINDLSLHSDYPSLYHFIFQVFSESKLLFYLMNVLVICGLIPYLLFVGTKTYWSTLLYFCGVALPHTLLYGATYPQAIVLVLVLIYFINRKNILVYLVCLILASIIHRHGFYLFVLVLVAELINFILKILIKKYSNYLSEKNLSLGSIVLGVYKFTDVWHLLFFLITQISFPIWFYAKRIFLKPFWLVMAVVPLFLLNFDSRLISISQLSLIFFTAPYLEEANHKKTILLMLGIYLIFFLLDYCLATIKMINSI